MTRRIFIFGIRLWAACMALLVLVSPIQASPLTDELAPDWTELNALP